MFSGWSRKLRPKHHYSVMEKYDFEKLKQGIRCLIDHTYLHQSLSMVDTYQLRICLEKLYTRMLNDSIDMEV